TPAAAIVSFHALFVIGIPRGWAEPAVVIEAIRNRFFRQCLRRRKFSQLRVDCVNVADPAVANDFASFSKSAFGTLLRTDLQNRSVLLRGIAHQPAFADGQ